MSKLHHATLKAAVANYAALHIAGKSEQEVKEAIGQDAKGFDPDEIDQIYAAIVNPPKSADELEQERLGKEQAAKDELARLAKEKADKEKADQEAETKSLEAEKAKAEKEEADRLAKEAADKAKKPVEFIVVQQFRDIKDWNTLFEVGANVSHLPADRLQTLIDKGLVAEQ